MWVPRLRFCLRYSFYHFDTSMPFSKYCRFLRLYGVWARSLVTFEDVPLYAFWRSRASCASFPWCLHVDSLLIRLRLRSFVALFAFDRSSDSTFDYMFVGYTRFVSPFYVHSDLIRFVILRSYRSLPPHSTLFVTVLRLLHLLFVVVVNFFLFVVCFVRCSPFYRCYFWPFTFVCYVDFALLFRLRCFPFYRLFVCVLRCCLLRSALRLPFVSSSTFVVCCFCCCCSRLSFTLLPFSPRYVTLLIPVETPRCCWICFALRCLFALLLRLFRCCCSISTFVLLIVAFTFVLRSLLLGVAFAICLLLFSTFYVTQFCLLTLFVPFCSFALRFVCSSVVVVVRVTCLFNSHSCLFVVILFVCLFNSVCCCSFYVVYIHSFIPPFLMLFRRCSPPILLLITLWSVRLMLFILFVTFTFYIRLFIID